MIYYCYRKWNTNRYILENKLRKADLCNIDYVGLLKMTIECIFNEESTRSFFDPKFNTESITEIDDGDYQGTLLYIIPEQWYQPSEYQYFMTYIAYGSCCCCDLLQSIQPSYISDVTDETIKDFMSLCRTFVANMIKPYNIGWRYSDNFEQMSMNKEN